MPFDSTCTYTLCTYKGLYWPSSCAIHSTVFGLKTASQSGYSKAQRRSDRRRLKGSRCTSGKYHPSQVGMTRCPETSVINYPFTRRNIPNQRPQPHPTLTMSVVESIFGTKTERQDGAKCTVGGVIICNLPHILQ
jgi:hypothetical protein